MKQFNRLPRWLRITGPIALVSGCMAINAVAFAEILQSFPSLRFSSEATLNKADAKPIAVISPDLLSESESVEAVASAREIPNLEPPKLEPPKLEPRYGHLPYVAASPADMQLIASYAHGEDKRYETLHPDAAAALFEMISAARAQGVWLVPASGFRTLAQQRTLFTAQIANKGTPEAAAVVSAPPGHSEHHTGYAVDLADGNLDQAYDISAAFADTPAYAWLIENAAQFGFELSFPQDNAQGISYEPWHWRYVGSAEAKAIFYPVPEIASETLGEAAE